MVKVIKSFLFFCLLAAPAWSQIPSGNVFIGYSHMTTNLAPGQNTGLNGWNASVEGKVLPFIGLVADFSGGYGSGQVTPSCSTQVVSCPIALKANVHQNNFLFGPRVSLSLGKFRPFVHALVGISHVSESGIGISNSDTAFADALGGGLDYKLIPLISWRIQLDALQTRTFSNTQSNLRVSTGVAIHF